MVELNNFKKYFNSLTWADCNFTLIANDLLNKNVVCQKSDYKI